MFKKLIPYMKKYRLYAFLAPATVIGEVLLEIQIPLYMAQIVDTGIPSQDMAYVLKMGGMMILMALGALLCGMISSRCASQAGIGFGTEIRRGLFHKVQDFSFANIDKFSTASLVTRLTTDVTNTQNAYMMVIRILVRAPVMLVSATLVAYSINSSLVTVFLVAIPFLTVFLILFSAIAFPRFTAMLKKYDKLNASVQENLIAIRVVKAFVRSKYEKEKFKGSNDDLTNASMRAEKVMIYAMPVMQLTMYSCIIAVLWFGGNKIIGGEMMTGDLISFVSYITQILMSLMMIAMVFINLIMSRASMSRIVEVLDEQPDITDAHIEKPVQAQDGSIEFCGVSFKYATGSGKNILENINLKIESGETVGIIGGTGSAKTSLVQLIPRLYDVTEGKILVGGHDVRDYKIKDLRKAVGMVLQKNVLFSGTIKENLKWGDENASDDQVVKAAQAAQADSFVQSFPDGYETDLSQGGVNVSGGQKQRLCIARALLKNPKILILDDSTSAVDTATDAKIRQALRDKRSGTTTIIIAQRITSVSDADKIIVLDEGRIDAIGTHEELLKTNEIYREVYQSQQKGVA